MPRAGRVQILYKPRDSALKGVALYVATGRLMDINFGVVAAVAHACR